MINKIFENFELMKELKKFSFIDFYFTGQRMTQKNYQAYHISPINLKNKIV